MSRATPDAWAVAITVCTLCCANTRSTATASGWCSSMTERMPAATAARRTDRSASTGVRTTPTWTSVACLVRSTSTMPTPHRVRPGSIPSTRRELTRPGYGRGTAPDAGAPGAVRSHPWGLLVVALELGLHLGAEVEVREHVLHVVAVLECVDEVEDLACGVGVDLDLE